MINENEQTISKAKEPASLVSVVIIVMDYQLRYLEKLMASIEAQTHKVLEVIIVNKTNRALVQEIVIAAKNTHCEIVDFYKSAGFAENNNIGISRCRGDLVFVLNLDAVLEPTCIEELVTAMQLDSSIGCVSPKILRMDADQNVIEPRIIDSAGMYLTKVLRHKDRGAGQIDSGQYDRLCYVFGVTGAGAFFRKACLDDVRIKDQYFDQDFWSYREDADICWRLQNHGWGCLYTPKAVMYHARTLKPGMRSLNSALANMHSVKNRYLLMINNMSIRNYIRYFLFIIGRDIVVVGGVLIREQRSFPAFLYLLKNMRKLLAKRRTIKVRSKRDVCSFWFSHDFISFSEYTEQTSNY